MSEFILRVLIIIPWLFIGWLLGKAFSGDMGWLLVITLVIILVPLAGVINLITIALVRGRKLLKTVIEAQRDAADGKKSAGRVEATNIADLPWYNPKRWTK